MEVSSRLSLSRSYYILHFFILFLVYHGKYHEISILREISSEYFICNSSSLKQIRKESSIEIIKYRISIFIDR